MAQELSSEMLGRLQASYGAMSDGELQELAAQPEDLTDLALEVLRGEMTRRGVKPLEEDAQARRAFGQGGVAAATKPAQAGEVVLMTFYDAMAAGEACRHLEDDGLEIDVRDVSEASTTGGSMYGGPPVALQVVVAGADVARAQKILREKMKLFPLQEVEGDELPDEGESMTAASFGQRKDADDVAQALETAGIWHQVTANPDGTAETEDAWDVQVREGDLDRALELVEKALGMAEG